MQQRHKSEVKSLKAEQEETLKQLNATVKALQLEKDSSSDLEAQLQAAHDQAASQTKLLSELEERCHGAEEELSSVKKSHDKTETEQRSQVKLTLISVYISKVIFTNMYVHVYHVTVVNVSYGL